MIKKSKIVLIFFSFICLSVNASLLWDIQEAKNYIEKKDYKNAKNFLYHYTLNNPNDEEGYWYLGKSYLELSDKKNATKYFKKSYDITSSKISIEKITFKNENENIEDYLDMAAMYFETGNIKEADYYADMMLKIDSKSSDALFIKAKISSLEGDRENAKKYLSQAIIFNNEILKTNLAKELEITAVPDVTKEIYNILALDNYFSGDIEKAIENLKNYLKLDKNPEIYNFLINCYLKKNDLNSAKNVLSEYRKIFNNDNLKILLIEAKIYNLENNHEKELNSILKAYEINPNNSEVLLSLGNYYLKNEDYNNAKKYFEILINVDDSFYEAYFGYIYSLIETGEIKKAINAIRKASVINPKSSEIPFLLSKICLKEANFKDALEYIDEAIKKEYNPKYYLEKAKTEYYLKNYNKSLESLNKINGILSLSDRQEIEKYYIQNYLKLKDIKKAQEYLNKKLTLDKNSLAYKYNLYVLYKLQGNEKKSKTQFAQIKKFKPVSVKDYIELSEINLELSNINPAIKIIDGAIKKFPNIYELYSQKMKLYYLGNMSEKLKETIGKTEELFE